MRGEKRRGGEPERERALHFCLWLKKNHCLAGRAHFCLGGVPRASGLWKPKPRPMRWSMSISDEDSWFFRVVRGIFLLGCAAQTLVAPATRAAVALAAALAAAFCLTRPDFRQSFEIDPIGLARSLAGVTDAASLQGGGPGCLWRRRVKRCGVIQRLYLRGRARE